jgi:hypothetical protein
MFLLQNIQILVLEPHALLIYDLEYKNYLNFILDYFTHELQIPYNLLNYYKIYKPEVFCHKLFRGFNNIFDIYI